MHCHCTAGCCVYTKERVHTPPLLLAAYSMQQQLSSPEESTAAHAVHCTHVCWYTFMHPLFKPSETTTPAPLKARAQGLKPLVKAVLSHQPSRLGCWHKHALVAKYQIQRMIMTLCAETPNLMTQPVAIKSRTAHNQAMLYMQTAPSQAPAVAALCPQLLPPADPQSY